MHSSIRLLAAAACTTLLLACSSKKEEKVELTTDAQKFGYSIGIDLGKSLKPVEKHIDVPALKQGLDDIAQALTKIDEAKAALAKDPDNESLKKALAEAEKMPAVKISAEDREAVKNTVSKTMQEEQLKAREEAATKSKDEGAKFLAENAKKEGVKTTASGLQYEVLKEGTGTSPTKEDKVTVHYKGTLLSGEEFDSSYSRGEPVTFPLGNVIPGWTEGVQLMKPGAKYKFYIPSELAYGERGAGVKIGPNQTLIFEVELLEVGKP